MVLRGPSLPNAVMRNIVNDIRDELKFNDTTVLCEVYDGQFHKLIVESEDGWPLMCLQHAMKHFNEILQNNDKEDLLEFIMNYSTISESDITDIENTHFRNGTTMEFEKCYIAHGMCTARQNIHQENIYRNNPCRRFPNERYGDQTSESNMA